MVEDNIHVGGEANGPFPEETDAELEGDLDDNEDLDPETERLWRDIDKADHPSSRYQAPKEDDQGLPN